MGRSCSGSTHMQFALAAGIPRTGATHAARKGLYGSRGRALTAQTAQPFRPELPRRKLCDRFQNPTVVGRAKKCGFVPKCAFFNPGPITSCRSLVNRAWGQCASLCCGLDLREDFRVRCPWPLPLRDSGRRLVGRLTARHGVEADDSELSTVDGRSMPPSVRRPSPLPRCASPRWGPASPTSGETQTLVGAHHARNEASQIGRKISGLEQVLFPRGSPTNQRISPTSTVERSAKIRSAT